MRVLVLNAGSSSLKASVVVAPETDPIASVTIEWPRSDDEAGSAHAALFHALTELPAGAEAVGHRVVHGGARYAEPIEVDDALVEEVERLDHLAPLHNRRAALVMRAATERLPDLPHVACFDTAFHADLPEEAWRYALPHDWVEPRGIRRFGFHGLSVAWAVRRAGELLDRDPGRLSVIVAHLGSGSSVTAVEAGRSVATSMGYTPFEGPVMGTRSGSIDPGIILELLRTGVEAPDLADGIATRAGLLGLSGRSSDVRVLADAAAGGDERAGTALAVLARSVAATVAAVATALPRLDALVFTGGIGEHATTVRSDVARRLAVLSVPPLPEAASGGDAILAAGPPAVLVVRAREDAVIAADVAQRVTDAALRDGSGSG